MLIERLLGHRLPIVDNLHSLRSNRNVLKTHPPRAAARRRAPGAGIDVPRRMAPDHPIALLQAHSLPGLLQREVERMILAGDLAA
ncbi:MAG: hypothetical protein ACYDDG_17680, partial [Casimicrobiaceae bacterium]